MKRLVRLARPLQASRTVWVTVAIMAAATLFACTLPGIGTLHYYSSLVLGLLGGILGGLAGGSAARVAVAEGRRPFVAAALAGLWILVPPPLILLLNGLRVTTCDPLEGLAFYLFGAGAAVLFATQVGAFCGLLGRRVRSWVALFVAIWLVSIGWDLLHLYRHPPIFAYNAFVGFFSGAIYDTVVKIDDRFVAFRIYNLAQVIALWLFARLAWDPDARRLRLESLRGAGGRWWAAFGVTVVVVATLFGLRGVIGFEVDRATIERTLGGVIESDRVRLVYDQEVISADEAAALLDDHHYRLDQLDVALGERYPGRVTSYVYGTPDRKRRLMGGSQVHIAKPWLEEIHLGRVAVGHPVIHHELAHVVLGRYARGPFRIPTAWGIFPHMALVEGAAEAFEWDTGPLTPHQWSAAMRRAGIAPRLETLLGPDGFYLQPSSIAYTLSGSFIRWLIDTHGAEPFLRAYCDADFEAAFGVPLTELLVGWERHVDAVEVPPDAEALARARFSGRAVLLRTCPLEVARMERTAAELVAGGRIDEALAVYHRVVGFVPYDPTKRLPILALHARRGEVADARAAHASYLGLEGRNEVFDARAEELLADAIWRAGDAAEAAARYLRLVDVPQDEDRRRSVMVKASVAASSDAEPILGPYLLDSGGAHDEAIDYLIEAVADLPDDLLATYLLGRRLAQARRDEEASRVLVQTLARLDAAPSESPAWRSWVVRESWRLLAHAHLRLERFEEAHDAFLQAADRSVHDGTRARHQDWAARARWRAERAGRPFF